MANCTGTDDCWEPGSWHLDACDLTRQELDEELQTAIGARRQELLTERARRRATHRAACRSGNVIPLGGFRGNNQGSQQ